MDKLKAAELQEELSKRGLDTQGDRDTLVKRLQKAAEDEKAGLIAAKTREVEANKTASAKRKLGSAKESDDEDEEKEKEEKEKDSSSSSDDSGSESGEGDSSDSDSSDDDNKKVKIKFRNYNPMDKKLKNLRVKNPPRRDQGWLMAELKEILSCALKTQDTSVDIIPKKANWDLKRDIAPQMEILKQKTQRAILELMRAKAEEQEREQAEESSSDSDSSDSSDDESRPATRATTSGKSQSKKSDSSSSDSDD
jgi:hypothetical protein